MWSKAEAGSTALGLGNITPVIYVRRDQAGSDAGVRTSWNLSVFQKQIQYT